ncbi:MAG: DUF1217 domain-containing protein [Rhodoblastus sp.]
MTTLTSYMGIARDAARWRAITSKTPEISMQTKYFQDNIAKVKNADDLIGDARLFAYAMKAFDLGDRLYAKGLMKQVLQQGTASADTLAFKLNNPNIKAFAKAFDFAGKGAQATASAAFAAKIVDQYVENAMEARQTQADAGVGLALYFQRKAPDATSVYSILADRKLLQVVQTALDISPMTGLMPIDRQAALLSKKLDIADFGNPEKLQKFITRFAAQYDYRNAGASAAGATATNAILLGAAQDFGGGFSVNLLQAMQAYRAY